MKDAPAARVKVLLFDVDGTLVRAGGAGRKALDRAVFRLYGKRGACRELDLAGKTDLRNFSEAVRAATGRVPGRREIDRVHREYLRDLPSEVSGAVREGRYRLCAGVAELLRRLSREEGVLLGLGTGNVEEGARIKLEPSGLNGYFSFGGFGSDSFHRASLLKTAVRRARKLLDGGRSHILGGGPLPNGDRRRHSLAEGLGHTSSGYPSVDGRAVRAGEVFVIGDTPRDVEAGRKAGFKTVGVGTGFSGWSELAASKPDHLAKDFRRISQWLDWLGLKKKTAARPKGRAKRTR
ncbi:MAG: HAD family hydrolase [Elusimicrobiota bacterium]